MSVAPAAEDEVGEQRHPNGADDHGHWVGLHGAAGASGLNRRGLGNDCALVTAVVGHLRRDLSRAPRVITSSLAGKLGAVAVNEVASGTTTIIGSINGSAAAVIGHVVRGVSGDAAGVAREFRQAVLCEVAGCDRLAAQIVQQALCAAIFDTVYPGHDAYLRLGRNALPRHAVPRSCTGRGRDHIRLMSDGVLMSSAEQRLDRQFERIGRQVPATAGFLRWVREPHMHLVRIPLALLLILGGIFSFLPILGLWMLPLGLAILAIDVPPLKRPVADTLVRLQRWLALTRRRFRRG